MELGTESLIATGHFAIIQKQPNKVSLIWFLHIRITFMEICFQSVPRPMIMSLYILKPVTKRLCLCRALEVKALPHYILFYPLHSKPRSIFLAAMLASFSSCPVKEKITYLVAGIQLNITFWVSLYTLATIITWARSMLED